MGKPLSSKAKAKIDRLINDHHLALKVEVLGKDSVSSEDYNRLVDTNVLKADAFDITHVSMQAAYTVGKVASTQAKSDLALARMAPDKFWTFIATVPPQFSSEDLDAIEAMKEHVGKLITNLGLSMQNDFDQAVHEEAVKLRHEALAKVQHEIALGVARRQSKEQIERRLKKKFKASERDWALVVNTELHNATEHGKALALVRTGDPVVYKLPKEDACRFCKMLFLNGKRPRLFRLSELVNNGTNYGRKAVHPTRAGQTEWRPVIGSVHPACQCELMTLPDGFTFDKNGKLIPSLKKSFVDELPPNIKSLIGHTCEA